MSQLLVNNPVGGTPQPGPSSPSTESNFNMQPSMAASNLGLQLALSMASVAENTGQADMMNQYNKEGEEAAEHTLAGAIIKDSAMIGAGILEGVGAGVSLGMVANAQSNTEAMKGVQEDLKNIGEYKGAVAEKTSNLTLDDADEEEIISPIHTQDVDKRINELNDSEKPLDAKNLKLNEKRDGLSDAEAIQDMDKTEADTFQGRLNELEKSKNEELQALKNNQDKHVGLKAQAVQGISKASGEIVQGAAGIPSAMKEKTAQLDNLSKEIDQQVAHSLASGADQDAQTVTQLQQVLAEEEKSQ
jgi:hypothetical protein